MARQYKEEISICTTRTLLGLGCRMCCINEDKCPKFKSCHNGVTPYEYNQTLAEESEEKENEEKC